MVELTTAKTMARIMVIKTTSIANLFDQFRGRFEVLVLPPECTVVDTDSLLFVCVAKLASGSCCSRQMISFDLMRSYHMHCHRGGILSRHAGHGCFHLIHQP